MKDFFESLFLRSTKSLDTVQTSDTLYKLVKDEIGSRSLIISLLERVMSDGNLIVMINAQTFFQNFVSLNLAGIGASRDEFNAYARALASKNTLTQLSGEKSTILNQICVKEIIPHDADHKIAKVVV